MTKMYDSADGTIPALPNGGAGADILIPTDGEWYANGQKMKAANPNAGIQTISEVGRTPAQWIDVEPGCVWPPAAAVNLWHQWKGNGCRGFYCSISLQPTIRALLAPGDNPEWFDANYTGIDHVDPGDTETQYEDVGPYDISEVPTPPPSPAPTREEDMPQVVTATPPGGQAGEYLIRSQDVLHIPDATCANWAWSHYSNGATQMEAVPWEVILWLNKGQPPS